MCSPDFGLYDFLFEKEDENLKTSLFAAADTSPLKDTSIASALWKEKSNFDAEDLLQCTFDGIHDEIDYAPDKSNSQFVVDKFLCSDPSAYIDAPCDEALQDSFKSNEFNSIRDLGEFPFDSEFMDSIDLPTGFKADETGIDSGSSDSGISIDQCQDFQLSPSSHSGIPSSPDTLDAISDVSSMSDLSSITELASFGPVSPTPRSTAKVAPFRQSSYKGNSHFLSELASEKINPQQKNKFNFSSTPSVTRLTIPSTSTVLNSSKILNSHPQKKVRLGVTNGSFAFNSSNKSTTSVPSVKRLVSSTGNGALRLNGNNISVSNPESTTENSANPQTIVVTQGGKESILRNGSFLKTTNGRSILLPVSVGDLNQVRTIKIITSGAASSSNKTGSRCFISNAKASTLTSSTSTSNSSLTTPSISTNNVRTALFTTTKGSDGRSLLKLTPTAMVTPNTIHHRHQFINGSRHTTSMTVGEVCIKNEPMDEDQPQAGQPLILSDEEKRLLRKEGLTLPSKYPLTKMEERDLKRIRRKIRNKISAQDSRKRKKEYVDGLEDRVKNSSDENTQLQKRIKHLETQNENLVLQLRRLQTIIRGNVANDGNASSSLRSNASTALMMIILSAALFVAPSLRPANERDLAQGKMTNAGQSRSLLEVSSNIMSSLEGGIDNDLGFDSGPVPSLDPLSDHDYGPAQKKVKMAPMDIFHTEKSGKNDLGDPPDINFGPGGSMKGVASMIGAFLNSLSSNWTEPGGGNGLLQAQMNDHLLGSIRLKNQSGPALKKAPSVIVNLDNRGRLRDDMELE